MASFNVAYHDRRRLDGPSLGSSPLQSPDEDDTRFGGMRQTKATATDEVRAAEVIASMCLATDLGMGFPFEHGLHATLTTMRYVRFSTSTRTPQSARTTPACSCMQDAPSTEWRGRRSSVEA